MEEEEEAYLIFPGLFPPRFPAAISQNKTHHPIETMERWLAESRLWMAGPINRTFIVNNPR